MNLCDTSLKITDGKNQEETHKSNLLRNSCELVESFEKNDPYYVIYLICKSF